MTLRAPTSADARALRVSKKSKSEAVGVLQAGAAGLFLCAALAGCRTSEPTSPAAGLEPPVEPPQQPDLGRHASRASVETLNMYASEGIFSVCKGPSPFFEFDSSSVGEKDRPTVQLLANCMKDGPLAGKRIQLVGRTDPRGTEEYNEQLGLERAERVKKYLVTQGIEAERISTTSLGKEDASPSPSEWASDRRVEIRLIP